jgi:hypothetical protein
VALPQEQIYGRTPFEVLAPSVASFLRPVLERAHGGEHVEYERVDSRVNGEQRGSTAASRRTSTPTASFAESTAPNTTSTT